MVLQTVFAEVQLFLSSNMDRLPLWLLCYQYGAFIVITVMRQAEANTHQN